MSQSSSRSSMIFLINHFIFILISQCYLGQIETVPYQSFDGQASHYDHSHSIHTSQPSSSSALSDDYESGGDDGGLSSPTYPNTERPYNDQIDDKSTSEQYRYGLEGPESSHRSRNHPRYPVFDSTHQDYQHLQQHHQSYSDQEDRFKSSPESTAINDPIAVDEEDNHKDSTVGDMYYKKPTVESEYETMMDMDSSLAASNDHQFEQGMHAQTEYKTGHYVKPKPSHYQTSAEYSNAPTKAVIFQVPQPVPTRKPLLPAFPTIEMPLLEKLIPVDLIKNGNIKFPAFDFNFLLGSIFGAGKGDQQISFAAPEGAGNLIASLLGHGKPLTINAPDIDILGSNSGNTRTKIQGFHLPDFMESSQKLLQGLDMPKIDLSGHHETGLTVPTIEMPKTQSVGKSKKIKAILPLGPSLHFLRHIPLPPVPKLRLPELGPFKFNKFKMPKLDFTKDLKQDLKEKLIQPKRDGSVSPDDLLGPFDVRSMYEKDHSKSRSNLFNAITITKPKKIITAYPLNRGSLIGHVVIEDYPFGRQQYGSLDDGGEPEIGCEQLDKIIQPKSSPFLLNKSPNYL
ncbi:eukaryotic translation initiation factor 3 [Sarcoptes scabiei]|nr:eukaryotic translation initiation factor 3 [Sarcoptes scabiei]